MVVCCGVLCYYRNMEEEVFKKPKRRQSQDNLRAQQDAKDRGVDPVGSQIYGEKFVRFHRIGEIKDILPAFKDFYYQAKIKDPNATLRNISQGFNREVCEPMGRLFHPSISQVRTWRKKWDLDLIQQMTDKDIKIIERKNVHQIIKTRDDNRKLVLGAADDEQLEAGVRTLGGELLNDAMQMLRDDQELEEIYTDETLIKRRNYIVNVFSHATRLVHGKAALMLKASAEKRDTAGFLMSLLSQATAGKLSDEQIALLETAYDNKKGEVGILVNNEQQ